MEEDSEEESEKIEMPAKGLKELEDSVFRFPICQDIENHAIQEITLTCHH